jgi:hypothetical protein
MLYFAALLKFRLTATHVLQLRTLMQTSSVAFYRQLERWSAVTSWNNDCWLFLSRGENYNQKKQIWKK